MFEIMLHRRSSRDDAKGADEPNDDISMVAATINVTIDNPKGNKYLSF